MQNIRTSKIENMAARIHETGHAYQAGDEVEWLTPSAYNDRDTVQRREPATAEEVKAAEAMAKEWAVPLG